MAAGGPDRPPDRRRVGDDGAGLAGIPGPARKGGGHPDSRGLPAGVTVFHAGTALGPDGVLRVSGGRVLNVTAVTPTFPRLSG